MSFFLLIRNGVGPIQRWPQPTPHPLQTGRNRSIRECLKLHKGANSTNRVSVRFFYTTRNQHKSQQILENQNMSSKDSE